MTSNSLTCGKPTASLRNKESGIIPTKLISSDTPNPIPSTPVDFSNIEGVNGGGTILNYNLAGNGNKLGLVHDPKSRILGGAVGSAGIFTNADDLAKLAREMYLIDYVNYDLLKNIVSPNNLKQMGTVIFPNSPQSNKGLVGIYQKNPDRANKWLNPLVYGDNSFTAQGFTGAVASFDPKNRIHNNYLFSSIKDGEGKKPDGFLDAFGKYQRFIVSKTLSLLVAKKYYEMQSQYVDINQTFQI